MSEQTTRNRSQVKKDTKFVRCTISIELWHEINYALDNLNESEKAQTKGIKKRKWTFKEASIELGKYLHGKRKIKKSPDVLNFFN